MHPLGLGIGFGAVAAVLVLAAGILYRRRLDRYRAGEPTRLDDDLIRRIEDVGTVDLGEPIDLREVREEEERFWSETWDQPEEW